LKDYRRESWGGDDSCYFDRFLNPVCSPIFCGDFDTQGWTAHAQAYALKQSAYRWFLRIVSGGQRPRSGFADPPTRGRAGRCIRAHSWSSQFRYSNSFGWTRTTRTRGRCRSQSTRPSARARALQRVHQSRSIVGDALFAIIDRSTAVPCIHAAKKPPGSKTEADRLG
jgi:hypothetical protein